MMVLMAKGKIDIMKLKEGTRHEEMLHPHRRSLEQLYDTHI